MDPYLPLADLLRPQRDHVKISINGESVSSATQHSSQAASTRAQTISDTVKDTEDHILAIVANVEKGFEETALLVLKRRRKDPRLVKVVNALSVVKDLRYSFNQKAVTAKGDSHGNGYGDVGSEQRRTSDALDGGTSDGSSQSKLCLTLVLGDKTVSISSRDAQDLKDLLSVLRDSVKIAEDHAGEISHEWLRHYHNAKPDAEHRQDSTAAAAAAAASAPIFSRFTQSALLASPSASADSSTSCSTSTRGAAGPSRQRQRAPSPESGEIKITIGTFNVNGQLPNADTPLGTWIHAEDEADIVVVSLQEAEASNLSFVYWTPHVQDTWDGQIRGVLANPNQYERVVAKQLVGILLLIYVRREMLPRISNVAVTSLGVGLGGWAANKGAVAARFEIDNTSLCFVASHLSAWDGGEARERRRWDYGEIVKRLRFTYSIASTSPPSSPLSKLEDGQDESKRSNGKAQSQGESGVDERSRAALDMTAAEPDAVTLLQAQLQAANAAELEAIPPYREEVRNLFDHDIVFWAGDLNFRLELPIGEIKRLIRKRMFEGALLRFDELRSEMSAKSCFDGFQEQKIDFAPTYKFDRGTNEYDTSEKLRKPAWTDRILWRSPKDGTGKSDEVKIRPVSYESAPDILLSDHKPVSACFIVRIGPS